MANSKEVQVKIVADVEDSEVESLESKIRQIKNQHFQAKIDADTTELEDVDTRIKSLKQFLGTELVGGVKLDAHEVEKAEKELSELEAKKLQLKLDVETSKLAVAKNLEAQLTSTQKVFIDTDTNEVVSAQDLIKQLSSVEQVFTNVDTGEVVSAKDLIDSLSDTEQVFVDTDDGEAQSAKDLIESLTSTQQVYIDVDDSEVDSTLEKLSNLEGIQTVSAGIGQAKQGASELGGVLTGALEAQSKQDTNKTFLSNALNDAEKTERVMGNINNIIADLPGDDTALQGLLSSAVAMEPALADNDQLLGNIANSATDYFSAMSFYGKSSVEAQQDMTNYLLAGNTAELERSPILQKHIDKLKEANTLEERQKALAEALNEEHWGGMGTADTLNNKMETFNSMLERGQYNLGAFFQKGAMGAMDFMLNIDEATGGLLGMGIAAAGMAGPVVDIFMGIGQIGMGLKTLGEASDLLGLTDKLSGLKDKIKGLGDSWNNFKDKLDISGKWNTVKNTISNGIDSIKSKVASLGTSIRDGLSSAFEKVKSAMDTLSTKWNSVKSSISNGVNAIKTSLGTLKTKLLEAGSAAKNAALKFIEFSKTLISNVVQAAKNAALALKDLAVQVLTAGYNALKSAAMWVAEKAALVASTIADYAAAAAQWVLNAAMAANPITLIVIALIALAAALIWAYQNVDWFREMVNNAWQALQGFAGWLTGELSSAVQWLGDVFNNTGQTIQSAIDGTVQWVMSSLQGLWDYIQTLGGLIPENASITGNGVIDAALKTMAFILTLPAQIGMVFIDIIAKALGFGPNFTNTMIQSATDAVNGFVDKFWEIVNYVQTILQNVADYILSVGGLLSTNVDITGNGIIDSVLRVMMFMLTLPGQIGMIFVNLIAQALGFGDNFSQNMIKSAMDSVNGFVSYISQLPGRVWSYLSNLISRALSFASNFANNIKQGAINAVNGFVSWISTLPGRLKEELDKMLEMASNFAMEIANKLTGGAAGMVVGWITGSGEHSPGYMYDALIGELQAMANAPGEYLGNLIGGIAGFASDMANTLTEGLLGMDLETVFNTLLGPLTDLEITVQGFIDYVLSLGGLIPENVDITGNSVIDTILRVLGFVATLPLQISMYLMDTLMQAIGFGPNFSQTLLSAAWNAVSGFVSYIANLPGQLAGYLNNALSHAISFASSLPGKLAQAASSAVSQFTSGISQLSDGLKNELSEIISSATNFVGEIGSILYNAGVNAVSNFLNGLQRASPGKMQREFRAEITEMGEAVPGDSTKLLNNIAKLGTGIVDAFGEPTLLFDYVSQLFDSISNIASVFRVNLEYPNQIEQLSIAIDDLDKIEDLKIGVEIPSELKDLKVKFEDTVNDQLVTASDSSPIHQTVNLNLEIGSVDNDERVHEIVEAVRKELSWDNLRAGRTV